MTKNTLRVLLPVVLLLLASATPQSMGVFASGAAQPLDQGRPIVCFTMAAAGTAVGTAEPAPRHDLKSPESAFQPALVCADADIVSSGALVFLLPETQDRRTRKSGLQATAIRAPPRFIA